MHIDPIDSVPAIDSIDGLEPIDFDDRTEDEMLRAEDPEALDPLFDDEDRIEQSDMRSATAPSARDCIDDRPRPK